MSGAPRSQVHAVRFASRARRRGEHFHGYDEHAGEPHQMAYYVWLATSANHTVLIDAGIDPARPADRRVTFHRLAPSTGWPSSGSIRTDVDHVVLSHLHYDHTGTAAIHRRSVRRPAAELDYWTGPSAARITRERWLVAGGRSRPTPPGRRRSRSTWSTATPRSCPA